jgi:dTDP-4-dehydrorhamnose reductase
MRIVVLGSTGMLGSAVGKYLIGKYGEDNVFLSYRNESVSYGANRFKFDPLVDEIVELPPCEYMINCIGIIKPFMQYSMSNSIYINSLFPWNLAAEMQHRGTRMIHITTDCVFSGNKGNYTEKDLHDCTDAYGKSKSLGEPDSCMVIRTSIIGEEIHKHASLIEWAKSQAGQPVKGFTNHLWNGVTTTEYAKIVSKIIDQDMYQESLFHVFSNVVTKEQLLRMLDRRFQLNLQITPVDASEAVNRVLCTVKWLNDRLSVSPLEEQISEM